MYASIAMYGSCSLSRAMLPSSSATRRLRPRRPARCTSCWRSSADFSYWPALSISVTSARSDGSWPGSMASAFSKWFCARSALAERGVDVAELPVDLHHLQVRQLLAVVVGAASRDAPPGVRPGRVAIRAVRRGHWRHRLGTRRIARSRSRYRHGVGNVLYRRRRAGPVARETIGRSGRTHLARRAAVAGHRRGAGDVRDQRCRCERRNLSPGRSCGGRRRDRPSSLPDALCCARCSAASPEPEVPSCSSLLVCWSLLATGLATAVDRVADGTRLPDRRSAAGRNRIPPPDRGHHRSVQRPAAWCVPDLRRYEPQSGLCRSRHSSSVVAAQHHPGRW